MITFCLLALLHSACGCVPRIRFFRAQIPIACLYIFCCPLRPTPQHVAWRLLQRPHISCALSLGLSLYITSLERPFLVTVSILFLWMVFSMAWITVLNNSFVLFNRSLLLSSLGACFVYSHAWHLLKTEFMHA